MNSSYTNQIITLILCIVLFFYSFDVSSQNVHKVEIDVRYISNNYHVLPFDKDGVILLSAPHSSSSSEWNLSMYDTDLNHVWNKNIRLDRFHNYDSYKYENGKLFILFVNSAGTNNYYSVIEISPLEKNPRPVITLSSLAGNRNQTLNNVSGSDVLYFATNSGPKTTDKLLNVLNFCTCYLPLIIGHHPTKTYGNINLFNTSNKSGSIINLDDFKGATKILDLKLNPKSEDINVVVQNYTSSRKGEVFLLTYDKNGRRKSKTSLNFKAKNFATAAKIFYNEDNEIYIVGNYSTQSTTQFTLIGGVFISNFSGNRHNFNRYYRLQAFDRFASSFVGGKNSELTPRQERKVEKALARNKPRLARWYMNFNEILFDKDGNMTIVTETYYPVYETYTDKDGNTRRRFVGYSCFNTLVFNTDKNGELIWNQTAPLECGVSKAPKERVNIIYDESQSVLNLTFNYAGAIRHTSIDKDGETFKNEELFESEELRAKEGNKTVNAFSEMAQWYDNHYIAWGFEKDSKGMFRRDKRRFFMAKVSLIEQ